jgi:exopolyphosphatase/guanosine-5'-triphosphate,3'-diphosphate pyrophosphatase
MRVGAIDIGSNSIRLLVAEIPDSDPRGERLETVARAGESCRLGRGLHETGRVDDELVERAGVVVGEFVRRARSLGARHVLAAATAALRRASNGAAAAERMAEVAGTPVRILSEADEARLVYRAVVTGLGKGMRGSQCVVFDLGGGSTEVVSGVGDRLGRWTSLPFGAVTLTERWAAGDPPSDAELELVRRWVRDELMHGCALFPERTAVLAGVGGTVTVLAALDAGLTAYDPARLEGAFVSSERLRQLVERIVRASLAERREMPVMGEGRADIVGSGALVVEGLLERFQAPGLVCSTQGLRYGLARLAAEEWRQALAPEPGPEAPAGGAPPGH